MGFSVPPVLSDDAVTVAMPSDIAAQVIERSFPPEIAFLADTLDADILDCATRMAVEIGVTAEIVLLNEGILSSEVYYRRLAAHLKLPFAERPLRPAAAAQLGQALGIGLVGLFRNHDGWRALAAPRGAALREFIRLLGSDHHPSLPAMAMTSPERLEALMRHHRRRELAQAASHGLPDWDASLSARTGLALWQVLVATITAVAFCAGCLVAPAACLGAAGIVFTSGFLMAVLLRLIATTASRPPSVKQHVARRRADTLPTYTVIVPLFREQRVVGRLVSALDRLDYPRAKLDIILVIEANDVATLDAVDALRLPSRYRTVMAPAGRPRTKPRALNVALQFARGEFVVIYDAEDEPDPDQLRKAVDMFAIRPGTACLQARLAIDNFHDTWLAALFAVEYAALFHVVNPGLAALGLPIPLGGTSNHFRRDLLEQVNGWDAWNVTEDIDLGIRLARFGHRVGSLDSDTFEEAPIRLGAWLKQRSRWMKGWMVTLAMLVRTPRRLRRELGTVQTMAVASMVFGTIASSLLGPLCVLLLLLRAASGSLFSCRSSLDWWLNGGSLTLLVAGFLSAVWPILVGLRRRRLLGLAAWLPLYPVYLLLLCLASWQALFEVFGRPHVWAKTEHGQARNRLALITPG